MPVSRSLIGAVALFSLSSPALADVCSDLWTERNQIYKQAGYCFKTAQAIRVFGNAGCAYDDVRDVPLSARAQQRINQIVRMERTYGCVR
jgi:hypothetical protein